MSTNSSYTFNAQLKKKLFSYPYRINDVRPSTYYKTLPLVLLYYFVYGYVEARMPEGKNI